MLRQEKNIIFIWWFRLLEKANDIFKSRVRKGRSYNYGILANCNAMYCKLVISTGILKVGMNKREKIKIRQTKLSKVTKVELKLFFSNELTSSRKSTASD